MYGIFTYIYHKNQPNVGKYTSPMDPMGIPPYRLGLFEQRPGASVSASSASPSCDTTDTPRTGRSQRLRLIGG